MGDEVTRRPGVVRHFGRAFSLNKKTWITTKARKRYEGAVLPVTNGEAKGFRYNKRLIVHVDQVVMAHAPKRICDIHSLKKLIDCMNRNYGKPPRPGLGTHSTWEFYRMPQEIAPDEE